MGGLQQGDKGDQEERKADSLRGFPGKRSQRDQHMPLWVLGATAEVEGVLAKESCFLGVKKTVGALFLVS